MMFGLKCGFHTHHVAPENRVHVRKCWNWPRTVWATPFILFTLLLLGGWLNTAPLASAQGADTACNPAGDDNELLYCVWTVEPRFGGFYLDPDDSTALKIWLTDTDDTDDTLTTALAEINRRCGRDFDSATALEADYAVGQLKGWFDTAASDFHEQMTGVDLDEAANRITVMVADLDADQDTVAEHVAGLGVPAEAVQFEEFQLLPPDPIPAAQSSGGSSVPDQSLNGALEPMVGGGEVIVESGSGTTLCSIGFAIGLINDLGEYEDGFVTAGHCGDGNPGVQFLIHYSSPSLYGVPIWNTLSNGVDAQYVRRTSSEIDLGLRLIARPSQENTTGRAYSQAYLNLDAQDPYFEIIGTAIPIVGQTVHKVGRATGWTSGVVTSTCTTTTYGSRCVGRALLDSFSGDSGGPVFSLNNDDTAMLVGIHQGSGVDDAIFARVDQALTKLFYDRGITDVWLTNDLPLQMTEYHISSEPLYGDEYQPGETIEITYSFSEAVTLLPGRQLRVVIAAPGNRYPQAKYDAARSEQAGDDKLVFTWQVPDGVEGGIWVGPGVPGASRSIGDLNGNVLAPIKLDHGRSAQIGQKSGNPQMQWGGFSNSPLDGDRFQPGEEIHVTTRWDRPVKVDPDNPPYVEISMWPTPGWARAEYDHQLSEEQGLHRLVFTYTVQPGDEDTNGIWVGAADGDTPYRGYTSLHNPGGITDYSGRSPNRDWPTDDKEYGVETRDSAPLMRWSGFSSEPAHGDTYQPGEVIEVTTRWDRPVKVNPVDPPWVKIFIGSATVRAHWSSVASDGLADNTWCSATRCNPGMWIPTVSRCTTPACRILTESPITPVFRPMMIGQRTITKIKLATPAPHASSTWTLVRPLTPAGSNPGRWLRSPSPPTSRSGWKETPRLSCSCESLTITPERPTTRGAAKPPAPTNRCSPGQCGMAT